MGARALIKPAVARGKALLIRAALKLALKTRSIGALGVREIGREAGLNPNTFYRHFASLEDLGLSILDEVMGSLRQPLRDIRRQSAELVGMQVPPAGNSTEYWTACIRKAKLVARGTMKLYFELVLTNPEAFMIGVSEMSGSSSRLRSRLQEVLGELSADLADDIRIYQLLPMLSDAAVQSMSSIIIRQIFMLSTDYIDAPERREEIEDMANGLIVSLIVGAIALEVTDAEAMVGLVMILRNED